ncbi:AAA family ATPase [Mucilaginibacter sp. R-33]|uniref:AAA family ATPase n=1 Tax=Mucilaginibacter sp. R-33 TaxID=3416711 RepID=UPI003CF2467A
MLVEFSVENYLSFRGNTRLRLDAGTIKENPGNIFYPIYMRDLKLIKCGVVYGANATGKSNLLKAFRFMQQFVLTSSKESLANEEIPVQPFRLTKSRLSYPSSFEATFIVKEIRYRYGFIISRKEIHHEWLYMVDKKKEEQLFERRNNSLDVDKRLLNEPKNKIDVLREFIRANSLFISVLAQFNVTLGLTISNWFSNSLVLFDGDSENLINHTGNLLKHPIYRERIHDIIKKSDLGFLGIEAAIKEKAAKSGLSESFVSFMFSTDENFHLKTSHKVFDDQKKFLETTLFDLIKDESLGTQKYIALLGVILEALIERKILWVDELDSRFHEHLLKMIVGLFNSKDNNPNGAQLICTCHNTSLLKKTLRRDQMIFAERDETGATSINSLYIKDASIRNDASFDKDYSAGKYGAIPKLEQLNLFNSSELENFEDI